MPGTPLTLSGQQTASTAHRTSCSTRDTQLHLTTEEADRLAALSKTLGHPVRVQIVDLLSRYGGDVCVCDIERHFDLTQPTISHHLKVLRAAGLIDAEQRGLWVYYQLRPGALDGLRGWLDHLK
ncbi:ArsR/SmtB family transcription factor [Aggregatilinea lenta]|uniref:ArsR/SmtB family transcription factor n=1 Tax=Aggregatilinea lenta TaxID=913108 RepID=UPI000E5B6B5F|nr:metalloregulator ArsR/SmtB family transcription factor [Aggregatilinea lenta]